MFGRWTRGSGVRGPFAPHHTPAVPLLVTDPSAIRPLAVVTGATAGIGRRFGERFAARGHDLLLVARDGARLDAAAAELAGRHGVTVDTHAADLGDTDAVEALATRLADAPHVDVLVNNAGFGTKGALARIDPAEQQRMVRVQCLAPVRLAQAVLPGMVARRSGAVINVASIAAFISAPGNATYGASKAFVRAFSEAMAAEVARDGVRVQALCPGFTRTEFHARMGGGDKGIPAWLWMSADAVVDASLRALDRGGPVTVIPGLRNRLLIAAFRHMPLRLLSVVQTRMPRRRAD
jgi:short-subunit dehydrogenase